MTTSSRTILALAALALTGGCLADESKKRIDCGEGATFAWAGADYCIYTGAIIIEGFDCPAAAPFRHDSPEEGVTVCSSTEGSPEGGWDDMIDAWHNGQHPPTDASDGTNGDAGDTTPPRPLSACEQGLDVAIGAAVGWVGPGCVVEARCDVGFVAKCGPNPYSAECVFGEPRIVPIASTSCPVRQAGDGEDCIFAFGDDACAAGLFCDPNQGRCAPLPALCDSNTCLADRDCGGIRCAGGSTLEGRLGRCLGRPGPGDCWDSNDCPGTWTCQGVLQPCQPCQPCSQLTAPGQCRPNAYSAIGVFRGANAGEVVPAWYFGDPYPLIDCPAFTVEVRDEVTGNWIGAATDTSCTVPVVAPNFATVPFPAVSVSAGEGFDYLWARVRGSFWSNCTGATPDTCTAGPFEVTSEPIRLGP